MGIITTTDREIEPKEQTTTTFENVRKIYSNFVTITLFTSNPPITRILPFHKDVALYKSRYARLTIRPDRKKLGILSPSRKSLCFTSDLRRRCTYNVFEKNM